MNLKDNIKVEENVNGLTNTYNVGINASYIDFCIDKDLKYIAQNSNIKGYRKGNVPVDMVVKNNKGAVTADVIRKALQECLEIVVKGKESKLAEQPHIDAKHHNEGEDYKFTITVKLLPTITLPKIEDYKIENVTVKIEEGDIDEEIERILKNSPIKKDVDAEHKITEHDYVVVDYEMRVRGKLIRGGLKKDQEIFISPSEERNTKTSTAAQEAIADRIITELKGKKVGDNIIVKDKVNKDMNFDKDAAIPLTMSIKVKKVMSSSIVKLPELTDDFIVEHLQLPLEEGKSAQENLRLVIKKEMEDSYSQTNKQRQKMLFLDKFSDDIDCDLPENLMKQEKESILSVSEQQQKTDDTKAIPTEEKVTQLAARRIKTGLALVELAQFNGIGVNEEEVDGEISMEALKYTLQQGGGREQLEQVLAYYKQHKEAIANDLLERKTMEYALSKVELLPVEMSIGDFDTIWKKENDIFSSENTDKTSKTEEKEVKLSEK